MELTEFDVRLDREWKRNKRIKDNPKVFGMSNWKDESPFTKGREKRFGQENQEFGFQCVHLEMPISHPNEDAKQAVG